MSIAGKWINEYKSTMEISVDGPKITGIYRSSTGSTGAYSVKGYRGPKEPTPKTPTEPGAGQPIALGIDWHSIESGEPDPSWHWVSGYAGQFSIQPEGEKLVLANALVATQEFPTLCGVGTFIDKLTFVRDNTPELGPTGGDTVDDVSASDQLSGVWISQLGTKLDLKVIGHRRGGHEGAIYGEVSGTVTVSGTATEVAGFTDVNASGAGLTRQAVTLSALVNGGADAVVESGYLDLQSKSLVLLRLDNRSTAPAATYVQSEVSTEVFVKQ